MDSLSFLANWAQIISLLAAIIALIVSVWIFRLGQQRRALTCFLENIVSPIEIKAGDALLSNIEIRYRGQAISNLFVMRARLENTGNMPLIQSDIIEPITFFFGSDIELLRQPEVIATNPMDLKATWRIANTESSTKPNAASLDFMLLNPKDSLTTEFIWTGNITLPKITARIKGISQIERFIFSPTLELESVRKNVFESLMGLCIAVGLYTLLSLILPQLFESIVAPIIVVSGLFFLVRIILSGYRSLKAHSTYVALDK